MDHRPAPLPDLDGPVRGAKRTPGAIFAAALSGALTAALWAGTRELIPANPAFREAGDDHVYLYMALHPVGSFHIAPWSWRILVPALVRYLPMRPDNGFELVALTSIALTGFLVFLVARNWGFSQELAILGLLLYFSMSYATKFNIKDFWLTDSIAILCATAGILALQSRRLYSFAGCMLLGALAKESAIFIAPLCYTFTAERRWDLRALGRTLALAAPAAAALVFLRVMIPSSNGNAAYVASLPYSVRADIGNVVSYNLLVVAQHEISARSHVWLRDIIDILTSFGTLGIVLPALGRQRLSRVLIPFWPFLFIVSTQLLFTFNTQRLLVLAVVPVVIACLYGVQQATVRHRIGAIWFAIAVVAAIGMELASPTASSPAPALQVPVFAAIALMTLVDTTMLRRYRQVTSQAWVGEAGQERQRLGCETGASRPQEATYDRSGQCGSRGHDQHRRRSGGAPDGLRRDADHRRWHLGRSARPGPGQGGAAAGGRARRQLHRHR
jgi:hypothetical protein